jgi:hypothetical protein
MTKMREFPANVPAIRYGERAPGVVWLVDSADATAGKAPAIQRTRRFEMAMKKSVKKGASRTTSAKKSTSRKSSTRRYSPAAQKSVETEMKEMKQGKLKSGRSGKKVTNPKQAVAIGLSKARKAGAKVPAKAT